MKTSLAGQPIKRAAALNCLLINQLATPGLGSLMARRFLAGSVQLILALLGFCLVMAWFIQMGMNTYHQMMNDSPPQPARFPWLGEAGAAVFVAAWLLAWVTSLSVLRAARGSREIPPTLKPPLLPGR